MPRGTNKNNPVGLKIHFSGEIATGHRDRIRKRGNGGIGVDLESLQYQKNASVSMKGGERGGSLVRLVKDPPRFSSRARKEKTEKSSCSQGEKKKEKSEARVGTPSSME